MGILKHKQVRNCLIR